MTAHCNFPKCDEDPEPNGMCLTHEHTTVAKSGSWVKDRHDATSGGEH